jgi:hypothetical protein
LHIGFNSLRSFSYQARQAVEMAQSIHEDAALDIDGADAAYEETADMDVTAAGPYSFDKFAG